MAFTQEQEAGLLEVLAAFTNGKRINDLENAQGALKDMSIEVMDETGEPQNVAVRCSGTGREPRSWPFLD